MRQLLQLYRISSRLRYGIGITKELAADGTCVIRNVALAFTGRVLCGNLFHRVMRGNNCFCFFNFSGCLCILKTLVAGRAIPVGNIAVLRAGFCLCGNGFQSSVFANNVDGGVLRHKRKHILVVIQAVVKLQRDRIRFDSGIIVHLECQSVNTTVSRVVLSCCVIREIDPVFSVRFLYGSAVIVHSGCLKSGIFQGQNIGIVCCYDLHGHKSGVVFDTDMDVYCIAGHCIDFFRIDCRHRIRGKRCKNARV